MIWIGARRRGGTPAFDPFIGNSELAAFWLPARNPPVKALELSSGEWGEFTANFWAAVATVTVTTAPQTCTFANGEVGGRRKTIETFGKTGLLEGPMPSRGTGQGNSQENVWLNSPLT